MCLETETFEFDDYDIKRKFVNYNFTETTDGVGDSSLLELFKLKLSKP